MRTLKLLAALLLAGALLLSACSSSDGGAAETTTTGAPVPVDVGEVLQGLAQNVIVPSYVALGTALDELAVDTEALCVGPSQQTLDRARSSWSAVDVAWQKTRAAGIGPALDDRLMSDIGFAARQTVVDDLLESGGPLNPEGITEAGSAAKGIYAYELLVFGKGSDVLATGDGLDRCGYARSVAIVAQDAVDAITKQWTAGDATKQLVAGLDGGQQSSVALLVNEVTHRLDELDTMGLRDMAEAQSAKDLDPSRVGGPADQRLADRKALFDGISIAIGNGKTGISALVGAKDGGTRDRLLAANDKASQAMAALPDSVSEAYDDPAATDAAADAVAKLKVLVSTEVASKLGVTITFSDSDGDS